jgi:hypothetical protein
MNPLAGRSESEMSGHARDAEEIILWTVLDCTAPISLQDPTRRLDTMRTIANLFALNAIYGWTSILRDTENGNRSSLGQSAMKPCLSDQGRL